MFSKRLVVLPLSVLGILVGASARAAEISAIEFLGEAIIPFNTKVDGTPVGGLSGITFDPRRQVFYAISDDPASKGPARFYTLALDLTDGHLEETDVEIRAVTLIRDRNGAPFRELTLDGEGIRLTPERTLYISSEGQAERGVLPFLREYELDGTYVRDFKIPKKFLPTPENVRRGQGVRHNLVFESMTLSADAASFFTATENALRQDGPASDVDVSSPSRILQFDRRKGRVQAEYVYFVEPAADAPPNPDNFRTSGLVELVSLGPNRLLSLERSFTAGVGNDIKIFQVSLDGATDVRRKTSLAGKKYRPVQKKLLLAFKSLGRHFDNVEGMSFGPRLPDGRRTLVLVADNNFSERQHTQVLAFAVSEDKLSVAELQGSGHISPFADQQVQDIRGVVTAQAARGPGFWLQTSGDGDDSTSDALFVQAEEAAAAGASVIVDGRMQENGFPPGLTVTTLEATRVEIGPAARLPEPVTLGEAGRQMPSAHIDDDGLESYQPSQDTIDFLESLEGMRVAIPDPVVIGPTTRFGEFAVLANGGLGSAPRSTAGGLVTTAEDLHPERLLIVTRAGPEGPRVSVGDRFAGPIVGILNYAFGTFRILAEDLPAIVPGGLSPASTSLKSGPDDLIVASYNVENLSARSVEAKFQRIAETIVSGLNSPDIVAVQEVQDDTGPEDDGTTAAVETFGKLRQAILAAGGPPYDFCQVDPKGNADGGQPGANIRVGFLYRSDRVSFTPRHGPDAGRAAELLVDEEGVFVTPNPGRIGPNHPAFAPDPNGAYAGVRKPLVAEFVFNGRRLFFVNLHLRSKRGDAPLFGSVQPPTRPSENLRIGEADVIRDFLDDLLELDTDASVVVLGDFNEHPYREPVRALAGTQFVNLIERVPQDERYTYIFRGNSQVLDNVLISPSLTAEAMPRAEIVHLNADFPDGSRAADHDPVLLLLSFPR